MNDLNTIGAAIAPAAPEHNAAPAPAIAPLSAMGLELEYMIVDRATLDIRPYTERLFRDAEGDHVDDIEAGDFGWSKEVVRHVIEIKNPKPVASLEGLADGFH